jgi:hypothetical protein
LPLRYTVRVTPIASHHRLTSFWIAFADDRETVLGKGRTAQEALKKAQKKSPATLILTQMAEGDEIPNDELRESIRQGEEEIKNGTLTYYETPEEFLKSLD